MPLGTVRFPVATSAIVMPRSYASDLLVDDIDLDAERVAGRPARAGRRRSDVFMALIAAGACAAVLFNALALQAGRPGGAPRASAPAASAQSSEIREIPTAPAAVSSPVQEPATFASVPAPMETVAPPLAEAVEMSAPAIAVPLPPVKPAAPPMRAPAPQAAGPASVASTGEAARSSASSLLPPADIGASTRVMEVQKALARLGYGPIRIDGAMNPATRQAIESFERDRRMRPTGEVTDLLVRELNAVAGFSIR